ncbi:MAG: hypothetical protein CSH36_04420 [Thalassolituus sp.]|nr:MAG: hypothetical protein CSH36_04420 [Thalassolituus sp.]
MRAELASGVSTASRLARLSGGFIVVAIISLFIADIHFYRPDPWQELGRIGLGLITPYWPDIPELALALGYTVAFALLAVAGSAFLGLFLAMWFHWRIVRVLAASIRSVHEVFWGLLFMQVWGLSATTGLLAILIPFTGIFTKVFADILHQQSPQTVQTFGDTPRISRYVYGLIPKAWPELISYVRYRFECALRSSAILGFIGLPTLGFHLETAFKQGQYSEAAAVLWVFLLLIGSVRLWLRPKLIPLFIAAAIWVLPEMPPVNASFFWQFITQDLWPKALQRGDLIATGQWYGNVFLSDVWPALWQTLAVTQAALVLSGLLALMYYPFASRWLVGGFRPMGRFKLLVLRSVPELMLAYVFMLIFGPSALPAILALGIHNGGLIAFLLANNSEDAAKVQRPDSPTGAMRFFYQDLPQRYPAFLALLFYRWEVIMRESAMMGVLGIATLGFYVDSAFEEIRFDKAFFLIVMAAVLNIIIDSLSRRLRRRSGLRTPLM